MKKYPAVAIITTGNCCSAVESLKGAKSLAVEAPMLPLKDCSMPQQCQCRFKKYADRRSDEDDRRSLGASERSIWYSGEERRKPRSRRSRK
ncbi:MAG: hypothetical protein WAW79_12220 [Steroidobacteraceae bacterium]